MNKVYVLFIHQTLNETLIHQLIYFLFSLLDDTGIEVD